jgi:hypothetical protein
MNATPTTAPEGARRGRHTIRNATRRIAAAAVGALLLSGLAPAAEAADSSALLQVNFTEGRRFSKLWVSATGTVSNWVGRGSVTLRIGRDGSSQSRVKRRVGVSVPGQQSS